jgi:hypothetical protein
MPTRTILAGAIVVSAALALSLSGCGGNSTANRGSAPTTRSGPAAGGTGRDALLTAGTLATGTATPGQGAGGTITSSLTTGTSATTGTLSSCPSPTTPTSPPNSIHSQSAAEAFARSLLEKIVLPPSSRVLHGSPNPNLDSPGSDPLDRSLATATLFARVPISGGDPSSYIFAHAPRGFSTNASGDGVGTLSDRSVIEVSFTSELDADPPPGVADIEIEVYWTPPSGGSQDVRVDVQVVWTPPRPAAALVPVCDRVAIVSLVEPFPQDAGLPVPRRVIVTNPDTVGQLRAAADGLQTAPNGMGPDFLDMGTRWIAAFAPTSTGAPNITFTVSVNGINVSVPGHPPTALENDQAFHSAYDHILGLPQRQSSGVSATNHNPRR